MDLWRSILAILLVLLVTLGKLLDWLGQVVIPAFLSQAGLYKNWVDHCVKCTVEILITNHFHFYS